MAAQAARLIKTVKAAYLFAILGSLSLPAQASDALDETLTLPPETVERSPVLQRWVEEVPDVLAEIRHEPSFRSRLQVGYATFPSSDGDSGLSLNLEDWFVSHTPLTLNADYQSNFRDRTAYGATLRYYVLPLGGYVNVAPVLGYRHFETADYDADGVNLGFHLKAIPSRGGGADFGYTQTWTTGHEPIRTTQLEFGYAVSDRLRVATDVEWQFGPGETDSRLGVGLEWML
ncbi:MAG: hypothetical protein F6J97_10625 [Leptolyngbya sp. SIO4C1]|nr:hypothetical protein [Leptolyngbya sp. SIO4C1]